MFLSNSNLSICIVGDFNLPLMDWDNNLSPNHDVYTEFLSYFTNNSLLQLVKFPTRENNLLDIILSDHSQQISNISSFAPIGTSDHLTLLFDLALEYDIESNICTDALFVSNIDCYNFSNYKYNLADWANIRIYLSTINWYELFGKCVSVEECWTCFCSVLHDIFNTFIPKNMFADQRTLMVVLSRNANEIL